MASASSGVSRSIWSWKESKTTEICWRSPPSAMNAGLSSRSAAGRSAPLKGNRMANRSCQCALTKPGRIILPRASIVRRLSRCRGSRAASISSVVPAATIRSPSTSTEPSGTTRAPASAG
ncbi:hypothetical protein [Streptosporangium vulgare]|uniref:hypothetical protein n=1 Tax=Streptosporangium vulgare TaxID=46190 RepID=UPI0031E23862